MATVVVSRARALPAGLGATHVYIQETESFLRFQAASSSGLLGGCVTLGKSLPLLGQSGCCPAFQLQERDQSHS